MLSGERNILKSCIIQSLGLRSHLMMEALRNRTPYTNAEINW